MEEGLTIGRLFTYWTYGGFLAGIVILALMPLLANGWCPPLTAIFLLLPIYLLQSVRGT